LDAPAQVSCEECGKSADVIQNEHIDPLGKLIRWPKALVKPDGIYFAINCPACGERLQLISKRPHTGDNTGA
jgi:C4-type Zn-finger protein